MVVSAPSEADNDGATDDRSFKCFLIRVVMSVPEFAKLSFAPNLHACSRHPYGARLLQLSPRHSTENDFYANCWPRECLLVCATLVCELDTQQKLNKFGTKFEFHVISQHSCLALSA